ncbi:MAG: SdrD B-like domain-containing protein [Opitutaceae bacterium]|nr:SdrD B-like domain-containing protein [Opitutaceae bacterium]
MTIDLEFGIILKDGVPQKPAVEDSVALGFVSASPRSLVFTFPGQILTTEIAVSVPTGSFAGDYAWKVRATTAPGGNGWPANVEDLGSDINARILPEVMDAGIKPVAAISTPSDGATFVYNGGAPLTFPINYSGTVAATGQPLTALQLFFDEVPVVPYQPPILGTLTASALAMSPGLTDGGSHAIGVTAQNNVGADTKTIYINVHTPPRIITHPVNQTVFVGDTATFVAVAAGTTSITASQPGDNVYEPAAPVSQLLIVNPDAPTVTVGITAPAAGAVFNLGAGETVVSVPFNFTATTTTGYAIDSVSYQLDNGAITSFAAPGGYVLNVSATDAAGTVSDRKEITVTAPGQVTINGVVFHDLNVNGVRDGLSETGLAGMTVQLLNGAGTGVVAATTTGSNGEYFFIVSAGSGSYQLEVTGPTGLSPSSNNARQSITVGTSVVPPVVDVGFALNWSQFRTLSATGKSHGFWKTNIEKALDPKAKGAQVGADILITHTNRIGNGLALAQFNGLDLQGARTILSGNSQLKLQLLAAEFNLVSGAFIGGSPLVTEAFIYWGEVVLTNTGNVYNAAYQNFAKDWFDAYNNSHGGLLKGPQP